MREIREFTARADAEFMDGQTGLLSSKHQTGLDPLESRVDFMDSLNYLRLNQGISGG